MPVLRYKHWEECVRIFVLEGTTKVDAYRRTFKGADKKTPNGLRVSACDFFKRKRVKVRVDELKELKKELARKEFEVDAAYVLRRLVEMDRMDVADILDDDGSIKPVREWPAVWRQCVSGLDVEEIFAGRGDERLSIGMLKKIKWPDKVRNLELLGKHVGVNAFKEIQDHRSGDGSMTPPRKIEIVAG